MNSKMQIPNPKSELHPKGLNSADRGKGNSMAGGIDQEGGVDVLLMGNEAIARGALEAGIQVAAAYPGTPSSEVVENLSKVAEKRGLYVEWSVNEKVAMEVAAAASFAGLRSLCVMKQNGVNVASDFLLHLVGSGVRGGMVLVTCDDPGALSSVNEGESRHFARMVEIPLLEPGDFQEAKDMIPWAFALSEEIGSLVMVRSVTRMSHASGNVMLGRLPTEKRRAFFGCSGDVMDLDHGPLVQHPRYTETCPAAGENPTGQRDLRKECLQLLRRSGESRAPRHHEQRLHALQQGSNPSAGGRRTV